MPPKKGKKGKKGKEPPPPPEPELKFEDTLNDVDVLELNLLVDINDDFFSEASKIIQFLMEANRFFEASRIKRYVDIIFNLHRRYTEEANENDILRPQIQSAENKLRLALELTATSEDAMQKLKESLGDAWKESDASILREQLVQEKLQEILVKCAGLNEKGSMQADDTAEFGHLAKYKNIILRERDRLAGEVAELEKRLVTNRYYSENLEYIVHNHEDAINKLAARAKTAESERLTVESKMRGLMKSMDEQKDAHNKTMQKFEVQGKEFAECQRKLAIKTADHDRLKLLVDKYRGENNLLNKQIHKNEEEIHDINKQQKQNEDLIRTLRLVEKEKINSINILQGKLKKSLEEQSSMSSKLYKLNRKVVLLNSDIVRLKNQINSLEKDLLNASGRMDDIRRLKENIQRERDNLRSDITKLNNQIADSRHDLMLKNNIISGLNLDINKLNVKLDESFISKSKAEKERDEMAQEVESLHDRIENYQEQVQLKTNQVTDLSEKLTVMQHEVHSLKKQLESVHSEKMILQRNLESTTQERDNFRGLQAKSSHQIQQLSNEININENKINQLNLKIEHLNNNIKEMQSELKNKDNLIASLRKELKELKMKTELLSKTITTDEQKFTKMGHELEEMRKERNLVGLQMVRRNDEIVLIKEKLLIAQTALDNGTTQYNQRVEDIRLLKKEISNLHTERECLKRAIKSTADMRREIVRLQRSLNQERIRIRALTEDAKTPTGIHRWRILRGEDPNKFELLEKLQVLQKRILKLSIENSNVKLKLSESTKTNETLKRMLTHMPTVEVKHKLVVQQRINRQMMKKLKTLKAERSLDEIELQARNCVINNFAAKLAEVKEIAKHCVGDQESIDITVNPCDKDIKPNNTLHVIPSEESNHVLPPDIYIEKPYFSGAESRISLVCEELLLKDKINVLDD